MTSIKVPRHRKKQRRKAKQPRRDDPYESEMTDETDRAMRKDVEENSEFYKALAADEAEEE